MPSTLHGKSKLAFESSFSCPSPALYAIRWAASAKQEESMKANAMNYDDFTVGQQFPPSRFSISGTESDEFVGTFAHGPLKAQPPAVLSEQVHVPTVRPVHPTLVGSFQPQHAAFAWPTGVLHARESVSLRAPVFPGETLEATVFVKNKYVKNDRKFIVLEIAVRKLENGVEAVTVERTLVWPS